MRVLAPLDFFGRVFSERRVFRCHGMGDAVQTLDIIVLHVWSPRFTGACVYKIRA